MLMLIMTTPVALATFYDELMGHDWHYDRSDDHGVWKRGCSSLAHLDTVAKTSPEHQALFRAMRDYQFGPSNTPKPARPAEGAPFTAAPPCPAPAALADLNDEDRASVLAAPIPDVRLREVQQRLDLDQRIPFDVVLRKFGAVQDSKNPARWALPDGATAMVKLDRKAWVEQTTLITGQGPVALLRRLAGLTETQAIQTLAALDGAPAQVMQPTPVTVPEAPAPEPSPVSVSEAPGPEPAASSPRRFIRRNC